MAIFSRLFSKRRNASGQEGTRAQGTTALVDLQGHQAEARAFCLAACEAEARRRPIGIRLRAVSGRAETAIDGIIGDRSWHIGHLAPGMHFPATVGLPVDAVLEAIRIRPRGHLDIRIILPVRHVLPAGSAHAIG